MKSKLTDWGYTWDEVNINRHPENKPFLKAQGHKTVPQLYCGINHLNKVNTQDFTKEMLEEQLDWDSYAGGVESFR
jgi:glutaredoxin